MKYFVLVLLTIFLSLIRNSENHIVAFNEKSCPIRLPHNFSQNHLLTQLTAPCRYNKKHTPIDPANCAPVKVTARIHVYHLKSGSEANAEFQVQLLLQLHWNDPRLRYRGFAPHIPELIGERNFIQSIWTPHIYLTNERDSIVLGLFRRDMLVSILPDGDLLFSTRLKTTIFCWVQLGKFPFDQQKCHLVMDSWRYNASELMLEWDPNPVTIPPTKPYLTEYSLMDTVTQVQDMFAEPSAVADSNNSYVYSSLTLTFILDRQYGFYLMDFYAPSILLVCISWVSFWMAPDAVPGRTILGASTMLTFFQLGIETGTALPNVSYIRSNDVWFFACTVFIFLSLAEFAFVNCIWRYGDQKVQLKKPTSKYILKSSVHPHLQQERRRSLSCQTSPEMRKSLDKLNKKLESDLQKTLSNLDLALPTKDILPLQPIKGPEEDDDMGLCLTSLPEDRTQDSGPVRHILTEELLTNLPLDRTILTPSKVSGDRLLPSIQMESPREVVPPGNHQDTTGQSVMSMQDIAIWVDNKSKVVFPLAFTLFNATYWGVLYQS